MEVFLAQLDQGEVQVQPVLPPRREIAPRDVDKEARFLLQLLCENGAIEVSAKQLQELTQELAHRLKRKPRAKAISDCVQLLEDSPAVEEIFVNRETLTLFVDEAV
jgi:hypothetical protein